MVEILVPFFFFFSVIMALLGPKYLRFKHEQRMKELEAGAGEAGQLKALMEERKALLEERKALEQRVQSLETIVCNVDFELNAKLQRLAVATQSIAALGPAPDARAAVAAASEAEGLVAGQVRPGQRVANRFVVARLLGAGGMGAVYLARDERLGEDVALKVIAGLGLLDPSAADRLRREASTARRISHPNVVRLHDIGEESGLLFLSMEYVAGESLAARLKRIGAIPAAQLRPIAEQLCDGLAAAHAAGVIHRDLKPANVLLAGDRTVKIIDFGIARPLAEAGMTATNMVVGTPEYMAPEQVRGGVMDARTDIYALGAMLYHALTGRPPFAAPSPIALGLAHCQEPVPAPRLLRPDIPIEWEALILRALEKDPARRFQSASELREVFRAAEAPTWHGPAPTVRV
ncbi:serine/threonine-protein kinase [Nannocystis sp. SCPEA4]|uniref:serine/threonine-protein kinase n=1 Tax=Nannocystis sp. SCPEA4 TaxID=2996787 RepID=UPI00226F4E1E|nr:serine/threonine-protein kinase [Nannocystis sp. SCPEA4]MCY1058497.1 serine/threonine-protein kinase [Nannocystis sp. SCPEA4]